jgi:hypothetical protein
MTRATPRSNTGTDGEKRAEGAAACEVVQVRSSGRLQLGETRLRVRQSAQTVHDQEDDLVAFQVTLHHGIGKFNR